ncbi:MAG: serine/threonine protein kinase [Chloroflexi bacterium]|nr:serine/threonine protein kinase [Chloroflexota bacterium]
MVSDGSMLSNRYLIVREVGSGGMGSVYEATDLRTGGTVAVKTLHPHFARDAQFVSRLRREAQIAASIRTPRAVKVLDLDEFEGTPYLVMEYVTGEDLADKLERVGRLSVDEALSVCMDITRALEGAHAVGVVHRDLKPQNVMITEEGEIKVLDFGIARAENQPGITSTNVFTGTPEYCAPERLDAQGDIRSDIYSVGVILYELVSGQRPFTGPTAFSVLRQHEIAPVPQLPPDVPPAVQAIVEKALAKKPAERFQTPAELMLALRAAREPAGRAVAPPRPEPAPVLPTVVGPVVPPVVAGNGPELVAARPGVKTVERVPGMVGPTPGGAAGGGRRSLLIAGGGLLAVALVGGGLFAFRGGGGASKPPPTEATGTRLTTGGSDVTPTAPPSVSPTATTARTPSPTPSPTPTPSAPPLIAPGERRTVNLTQEGMLTLTTEKCPGAPGPTRVPLALTITTIERDARVAGRITVSYVRRLGSVAGVTCTQPYEPDAFGNLITLETQQQAETENRIYRANPTDGTGLSVSGTPNLYGKEIAGTWIFDGVEFIGSQMALVQRLPDETVLHRIKLLPQGQ